MRIRTIKPEFWTDKRVASWDPFIRLFYIGLWSAADDTGRGSAEPERIAAELFPYDLSRDSRDTLARVTGALARLSEDSRITLYKVGEEVFFEIDRWTSHQRIDKPGKSKIPNKTEATEILSRHPRESLATPSRLYQGSGIRDQGSREQGPFVPTPMTLPLPESGQPVGCSRADSAEPVKKSEPKPKAPRERNVAFDALVESTGGDPLHVTQSEGGRVAKALADIRTACPTLSPDALATEIRRRAANYARSHPDWELTATALSTHWSRVNAYSANGGPHKAKSAVQATIDMANRFLEQDK